MPSTGEKREGGKRHHASYCFQGKKREGEVRESELMHASYRLLPEEEKEGEGDNHLCSLQKEKRKGALRGGGRNCGLSH